MEMQLSQRVKQTNVLTQLAPELKRVALCLNARACTVSGLRKLVLAVSALSLEKGIDALTLLTSLALLA